MLSRRQFFRAAAVSAAVLPLPKDLLFAVEPQRRGGAPGGHDGQVILNSNENAYGPFPSVMKAMQEGLRYAHRYPDSHYDALYEGLAKHHNVKPENIWIGCGSGDVLRMAADEFTGSGRPLVMGAPSFEELGMYTQRTGGEVVKIPLRASDQAHDLEKMLAAAQGRPSLVYVCNPNNPTGSLTPRHEIEQFLKMLPSNATVIIDEAYHHFVTDPTYKTFADNSADDPRVIVLRTFSKIYGLAGMRVGYGISHPQTIEKLSKHYVYDNPNVVGTIGAIASLQDPSALASASKRIVDDRNRFTAEAQKRKLKVIPSQANFIMFDSGKPVRQAIDFFKKQNVLIGRPFPPYATHLRISLGLADEMQAFWRVWDQYSA